MMNLPASRAIVDQAVARPWRAPRSASGKAAGAVNDEALMFLNAPFSVVELPADGGAIGAIPGPGMRMTSDQPDALSPADRSERARQVVGTMLRPAGRPGR